MKATIFVITSCSLFGINYLHFNQNDTRACKAPLKKTVLHSAISKIRISR